ncbi:hypothetical protein [Streptomyces sp. NPDC003077]|uniref:hypothetical protein n=1 Tax=Streptomyces sp. NPDC003077 TaxID=3154443 RepID=UPI00339DE614
MIRRSDGTYVHYFKRRSLGDRSSYATMKTKARMAKEGESVRITYSPKRPNRLYPAGHYPPEHWKVTGMVAGIGLLPILFEVIQLLTS